LGFRRNRSYPSRPDNTGGASDTFANPNRPDRYRCRFPDGEISCPWGAADSLMIASFATIRRPTLAVEGALWHSGRMFCNPEVYLHSIRSAWQNVVGSLGDFGLPFLTTGMAERNCERKKQFRQKNRGNAGAWKA
jgi:hypothetical protein